MNVMQTNSSFNSTLVQLKVNIQTFNKVVKASFNSTLVQLKVLRHKPELMGKVSFNSTLVQLKEYKILCKTSF